MHFCTIESILMGDITAWFGNSTTVSRIGDLSSTMFTKLQYISSKHYWTNARKIVKDLTHSLPLTEGKHRENKDGLLPTDHSSLQPGQHIELGLIWTCLLNSRLRIYTALKLHTTAQICTLFIIVLQFWHQSVLI